MSLVRLCVCDGTVSGGMVWSLRPHTINLFTSNSAYLPGTGDTVIHMAVPPERGLSIAPSVWLTFAITPNAGDSGAQFLLVGDCVRAIP